MLMPFRKKGPEVDFHAGDVFSVTEHVDLKDPRKVQEHINKLENALKDQKVACDPAKFKQAEADLSWYMRYQEKFFGNHTTLNLTIEDTDEMYVVAGKDCTINDLSKEGSQKAVIDIECPIKHGVSRVTRVPKVEDAPTSFHESTRVGASEKSTPIKKTTEA